MNVNILFSNEPCTIIKKLKGFNCKGKAHGCAGMYMGYVKYLKEKYQMTNKLTHFLYHFLERYFIRGIKEYTQFVFTEFLLCFILLTWLLPMKYKSLPIVVFVFLFSYINKSCINV